MSSISYNSYKERAASKDLDFDMTEKYYKNVVKMPCYYCDNINGNGLDRVNNDVGYISSNVVSCCSECNYMKFDTNIDDFIVHCCAVYECSQKLLNNNKFKVETCLRSIKKRNMVQETHSIATYDIQKPAERTVITKESIKKPVSVDTSKQSSSSHVNTLSSKNIIKSPVHKEKSIAGKKNVLILDRLNDDQLIELFSKKGSVTTQDASDYIKEKYNIIIRRNEVSNLWDMKIEQSEKVKLSDDYKKAVENNIKRVYKKEKTEKWRDVVSKPKPPSISDEKLMMIMNDKTTSNSAAETSQEYTFDYGPSAGKTMSRTSIQNIWSGKVRPNVETEEYLKLVLIKRTRKQ